MALGEPTIDVLDSLRDGHQTIEWLVEDTGRERDQVQRAVWRLLKRGLIAQTPHPGLARYRITWKGREILGVPA